MDMSIIIPCADDVDGLKITLDSILAIAPADFDHEIIVANDGAVDDTSALIASYGGAVAEVVLPVNAGSYAARNAGIEVARGRFLAFIDAGCWLEWRWFRNARMIVHQFDYIAGNVITPVELCDTLGKKYSAAQEFNSAMFFRVLGFGVTANLIVRRTVIDDLGGFDDRLWSGGDREFGRRVIGSGRFRPYFAQSVIVFHEPRTLAQMVRKEKRVIRGFRDLKRLHPDLFGRSQGAAGGGRGAGVLGRALRHAMPPSRAYARRLWSLFGWRWFVPLYVFSWGMRLFNIGMARFVR